MSPQPRRILYVQRPDGGGSATALRELIRNLDRDRFEPIILFSQWSEYARALEESSVEVFTLNQVQSEGDSREARVVATPAIARDTARQGVTRLSIELSRFISRKRIDLVHHNNNLRANRASVLAAILAGTKQICHMRYMHESSSFDRLLARRVDHFVFVSRAVAGAYRGLRVPAGRGMVIYDPVNAAFLDSVDGLAVRKELGLSETDRVVACIGRIVPWKGQDYFLRAMANVIERHPQAKALVVGGPNETSESQDFHRLLSEVVGELGIEDHVVFTGFRADIPAIVAASDLVVHSSAEPEPLGLVIVEALAGGRPVVATRAGGVPEIVEEGITGLLVPPRDASGMATAIGWCLDHPDEAEAMGARGREVVRERFAPTRHVELMEELYDRVLGAA